MMLQRQRGREGGRDAIEEGRVGVVELGNTQPWSGSVRIRGHSSWEG